MIVTEDEARKMWCQESFSGEAFECCNGADCMAWRWMQMPTRYQSDVARDGWEHIPVKAAPDYDRNHEFWLEPEAEWNARRKGFCGKAGWPHHA